MLHFLENPNTTPGGIICAMLLEKLSGITDRYEEITQEFLEKKHQEMIQKNYNFNKKLLFIHGAKYILPDNKILIPSYHPSPRNVNRKIINTQKMVRLLKMAKSII